MSIDQPPTAATAGSLPVPIPTAPDASPFVRTPDPELAAYADQFLGEVASIPEQRATVGCIIPAYNEAETIAGVLDSLLMQSRLPDVIHVIINNSSDDSVEIASHYAGPQTRMTATGEQSTVIYVHDIGKNPDKKVGALNYGFTLIEGMDYLLGVDGDTTPEPDAVEHLVEEITSDDRIGGISAIYSIDDRPIKGGIAKFLIAGQRTQFAAFNLQNLLRGRNMAVLGGQFSIFSTHALREAMRQNHQNSPWVRDSEVEDSLLSLQIKSAGYLTKISPYARANVGGMTTLSGYDAQQVKWTYGAIELMWPGQRGDTKGQPLHPNLRLRWLENFGMLTNLFVRVAFVTLLAGSLSINAFVFSPWWLIPSGMAILLNVRIARTMKDSNSRDILFAATFLPAEMFMWVRLSHFVRSWSRFFSRKKVDNWAMQAKAEKGGGLGHWTPLIVLIAIAIAMTIVWMLIGPMAQSTILWIGWPIVGVVTVLQTLGMFFKLVRRYHGYKV